MDAATLSFLTLTLMCCVGAGVSLNVLKLLPSDYDSTVEPRPPGGVPILVGISWSIKNVYEVNFREMSVLLSMYFRMSWAEPRLVTGSLTGEGMVPLHSDLMKHLWIPDLFIHETREITSFKMIEEVQGVYLRPPNTILFSTLLQTRLACPMSFSRYPFDVQVCNMTVTSYKFSEDVLRLEWMLKEMWADITVDDQLPNYDFHIEWRNITTKHWCSNCSFAPVSVGQAEIVLARRYALHLLTVYVPSALFVAVAWASFFWPPEVIPGRTVLIITSLLTVISMYAAIGQKSPETSYLKAIDVWLFLCIVLVVFTLFQYTIIITIQRKQKERVIEVVVPMNNRCHRHNTPATGGSFTTRQNSAESPSPPSSSKVDGPAAAYEAGKRSPPNRLVMYEQWVEKAGKVGIPLIFFICNIVYWAVYLS
ncbi:gamma-aminobutyric acid receptor subunit rho-1-like [Homarus americanus]|uniref:Gamma-aminobutyric acid receptor subunit rho-1-like 1 n=1 Tax=Homarus americanus TaxID=6706 RepID=A0A8J5MG06_HOMAM|nr:gamma-aminobutyric acid receptor subunit rho-1-like [Homarus americanus]KAG7153291.1 Gamma-aminobutyric acid receptor subunit rho-1-like 1 [Homarus americanus]